MTHRIACTALTGRIVMGRVSKDGTHFTGEKRDVTSDVLKAIMDKLEYHGGSMEIEVDGKPLATLSLSKPPLPAAPAASNEGEEA